MTTLPSLVERIAREACAEDTPDECLFLGPPDRMYIDMSPPDAERFLARFAQAIAAECAKVCDEDAKNPDQYRDASTECAAAIRARFGLAK